MSNDRELRKGSAETLILALLEERDRHGYEIAKLIDQRSDGTLKFHVASLYPTLYRLERRGLPQPADRSPRVTSGMRCACCAVRRDSRPSRSWRSRSASGRTPQSSAWSAPWSCARRPIAIRRGSWHSATRDPRRQDRSQA